MDGVGASGKQVILKMDDGASLLARQLGNPAGTRLAITHGNGFAVDGYRVFWEPLLDEFEVVLFDMRNHGRNAPTGADGHNYLQMARDMGSIRRGLDEQLGRKKTVAVCHSMSSRAAMKHAVEMEWVWDGLVLFDPPNVPPRGHEFYEAMRTFEMRLVEFALNRPDRFNSVEELEAAFNAGRAQSGWREQARSDMAHAVLRQSGEGDYVLTCKRELEASIYLAALTLELWPPASSFGGPVKMIGADPSWRGAPPTGVANRALAMEGGYEYEAIPETGHLLQIEKPDACRQSMLTFLRQHGLSRRDS
jgi:pimeloyl-ACP methyl ester carboxylesterase